MREPRLWTMVLGISVKGREPRREEEAWRRCGRRRCGDTDLVLADGQAGGGHPQGWSGRPAQGSQYLVLLLCHHFHPCRAKHLEFYEPLGPLYNVDFCQGKKCKLYIQDHKEIYRGLDGMIFLPQHILILLLLISIFLPSILPTLPILPRQFSQPDIEHETRRLWRKPVKAMKHI